MIGAAIGVIVLAWLFTDRRQVNQVVIGLGSGALIAAIAIGVVLTYRGSGVVNFANGAVAMFVAYLFDGLRSEGKLYLPPLPNPLSLVEGVIHWFGADSLDLPDWPTKIGLGDPWAFWPALVASLALAALLGWAFHVLIFGPLRYAPVLAKVVASVGLFIVMQAIVVLRWSGTPRAVKPILPKDSVTVFDISMPKEQLWVALIVVLITAGLWAVFRYSRFGLATRAAAENEKGAIVLGFSPDFLAAVNWVMSTVLAGLVGILVAPLLQLDPITMPLLIVPALGAALFANFTSFSITCATGLGIGMVGSLITYLGTKSYWPKGVLPPTGFKQAFPFLVIVIALFLRGKALPTRGAVAVGKMPFAPRPNYVGKLTALAVVAALFGLFFLGYDWRQAITNTAIGVGICLSLVVLTGFVGQISLAQMALAGAAGFALSKLGTEHGWPFPLAPVVAAVVATVFGLLISVPALRVRGVNLAVVTFAAALAIEELIFKNRTFSGQSGAARVDAPSIAGTAFGQNDLSDWKIGPFKGDGAVPGPWFGFFCLIVAVLLALLVVNARSSATGRRMLAVRSNERAAAAAGVSVTGTKLLAFGLAAFIAGVAGCLKGYQFGSVTPTYFGSLQSLFFLAFAYLGGISSVYGAVIGGFLVPGGVNELILTRWFHVPDQFTFLLGGIGLILTAVLNPEGIAGGVRFAVHELRHKLAARRGAPPAAPEAAVAMAGGGGH